MGAPPFSQAIGLVTNQLLVLPRLWFLLGAVRESAEGGLGLSTSMLGHVNWNIVDPELAQA